MLSMPSASRTALPSMSLNFMPLISPSMMAEGIS